MIDSNDRLDALEQQVEYLSQQLRGLQEQLSLVADVQRFEQLRQLLQHDDLDGADRETALLLEQALSQQEGGLTPESLQRCPIELLRILDQLWSRATDQQQGFSRQLALYRELGGTRETLLAQDEALFHRFCERVAWPRLEGVGFALPEALTVPAAGAMNAEGQLRPGHLPLRCWSTDYGLKAANLLMARLIDVDGT